MQSAAHWALSSSLAAAYFRPVLPPSFSLPPISLPLPPPACLSVQQPHLSPWQHALVVPVLVWHNPPWLLLTPALVSQWETPVSEAVVRVFLSSPLSGWWWACADQSPLYCTHVQSLQWKADAGGTVKNYPTYSIRSLVYVSHYLHFSDVLVLGGELDSQKIHCLPLPL